MNKPLSDIDYSALASYIKEDKNRRNKDRYAGLMFNSSELESRLKDKYFAVNQNSNGTKAIIFSGAVERDFYCSLAPEYIPADFGGFKFVVGGKWKNTRYYHTLKNNWIVYLDGERYDLDNSALW